MIAVGVGVAGAFGALARFLVDGQVRRRWPTTFPWATVIINVSGSLILGVLTGLLLYHGAAPDLKLLAGTGFCGGYTTFSTASFETVRLAQQRRYRLACLNGLGTAAATLGAATLGLVMVR